MGAELKTGDALGQRNLVVADISPGTRVAQAVRKARVVGAVSAVAGQGDFKRSIGTQGTREAEGGDGVVAFDHRSAWGAAGDRDRNGRGHCRGRIGNRYHAAHIPTVGQRRIGTGLVDHKDHGLAILLDLVVHQMGAELKTGDALGQRNLVVADISPGTRVAQAVRKARVVGAAGTVAGQRDFERSIGTQGAREAEGGDGIVAFDHRSAWGAAGDGDRCYGAGWKYWSGIDDINGGCTRCR